LGRRREHEQCRECQIANMSILVQEKQWSKRDMTLRREERRTMTRAKHYTASLIWYVDKLFQPCSTCANPKNSPKNSHVLPKPQSGRQTNLQQIAILRIHVAHLGLFVLGQTNVNRSTISLPVLPTTNNEVEDAGDDAENRKGNTDAVACDVLGRVFA
jgi:hypothetical protein